jgi:two-component system, chemotaxis family, CheB/CheR fusion protein
MNAMPIPDKILAINKIDDSQPPECFPVVGIGASAGGLDAFRQLLSHLPIDTGMAFVLIQHLEPNQKSLLSEILSRETTMPVVEVQQGMAVEPNCIYVIPPSTKMVILQGLLHLTPRDKTHGVAMPIDAFFLSLAIDRGSKAIAVVLSGGESDGARGLEAVKEAGGITFAQCEASAKVSSMPNTAVATGQVDFVLPPSAIAEELANISRHPYVVHPTPARVVAAIANGETALQAIFTILQTNVGVDFRLYKHTTLKRRILRRMVLYRLETLEEYVIYLQEHRAEVQALYEDILIHVTSFFRDPIAFVTLANKVFPVISNRAPDSPIRIWVVGCSTGEEVYSIAICLLEFLDSQAVKPPIQIYATDISDWAIEKARKGIYPQNRVADVSPERLQRFFVPIEDGYQIGKSVRELCVFAKQNLCSDPPFSKLDLISCRNVLIYLGTALQKKVFPIFNYALKSTGFLLLGTSETIGKSADLFTVIDKKYKIYSRKIVSTRLSLDLIANTYASEITNPTFRNPGTVWSDLELQREADRLVLDRYAPVGIVINSDLEIVHFRGQTSPYLESAPGRASHNLLKMAKDGLKIELRTAIHQAKQRDLPVKKIGLQFQESSQLKEVNIEVIPIQARGADERYFLVLFEDVTSVKTSDITKKIETTSYHAKLNSDKQEIIRLNQELENTKEYLRSIIEEQEATNQDLRAANEEILSSNEEFQSSNEELETAKEEIQATNEELNTINDELQHRNTEVMRVSNDLQNLISSTNIPILMLDSDLCIRSFTPLVQSILHLIPADVGRPFRDISPMLQLPDLEEQIREVMDTLTLKEQEVQDQNGHWYDLRIRPYRTIDNKIDGVILILVDIDALKRSMVELQYSHNYNQAIIETVREALIVLDKNLRVFTANQSFYRMFQTTNAETENHLIFELGNGQWNTPQLRLLLLDILPRRVQLQNFEVEHNFEHIGHRIMLLNARTMTQAEGGDSILLAIEDITDRKRLEADLAALMTQEQSARSTAEIANHAKDEFLAMVSHELRAPLTAILGWTHLLNNHSLSKAKITQALEVIDRSAKAQAQLIEDLLDISSINSGNFQLNLRPLQLTSVIEAAIEVVTIAAEAKQIQLHSCLEPGIKMVMGDPERLQQVIWNLLINAIKFTPGGGSINVDLAYINNQAQMTVTDTGCGIDSEFLPCVFDRFRQVDTSKTRSNFGLGLGLSIVLSLVELHGGTVGVTSPGKDQGTTFTVQLPLRVLLSENVPLAAIQINESEVTRPQEDLPSLVGVRVLVVDDEADVRQLLTVVLEQYGVKVTVVASAQEAIATLTTNPKKYDVLLSDIGMPGEDGYTLIRQIRTMSAEAGGQIPAAALTGFDRKVDHDTAIAAGFQWHLAKPVKQDQLLSVVAALAGRTKIS